MWFLRLASVLRMVWFIACDAVRLVGCIMVALCRWFCCLLWAVWFGFRLFWCVDSGFVYCWGLVIIRCGCGFGWLWWGLGLGGFLLSCCVLVLRYCVGVVDRCTSLWLFLGVAGLPWFGLCCGGGLLPCCSGVSVV